MTDKSRPVPSRRSKRIYVWWGVALALLTALSCSALAGEPPKVPKLTAEEAARLEKLIEQLGADDFQKRDAASREVRKLGRSAIPALRAALKSGDPEVVSRAEELLAKLDSIFKLVQDALADDKKVRSKALSRLSNLGEKDACEIAPILIQKLANKHSNLLARQALDRLGYRALPELVKGLSHPSEPARYACASIIARLQHSRDRKAITTIRKALGSEKSPRVRSKLTIALWVLAGDEGPAAKVLTRHLNSKRADVRRYAARHLTTMHQPPAPPGVAPALARCLLDEDREVREHAYKALSRIGPYASTAVPELLEALGKGDKKSLSLIAGALSKIGTARPEHLKRFKKMLAHENVLVRIYAAQAAWRAGAKSSELMAVLLKGIASEDKSVRGQAIYTVREMGLAGKEAIPALLPCLKHKDATTVYAAIQALHRMGPAAKDALPALRQALKDNPRNRDAIRWAIAEVSAKAAGTVGELAEALESSPTHLRIEAAERLGQMGPKAAPAGRALGEALGDGNVYVRWAAAEALGKIGRGARAAVPALMGGAESAAKRRDDRLCRGIAKALAAMGPLEKKNFGPLLAGMRAGHYNSIRALGFVGAPVVPEMIKALEKSKGDGYLPIIRALGMLGPAARKAVPTIEKWLKSQHLGVRVYALRAIYRITGRNEEAVARLVKILEDPGLRDGTFEEIIWLLDDMKEKGAKAAPALARIIRTRKWRRCDEAVRILSGIAPESELTLTVLQEQLAKKDMLRITFAMRGLGRAGAAARKALPALEKYLNHEKEWHRIEAGLAIWKITGKPDKALRVLRAELRQGNIGRAERAMRLLGDMGAVAAPAVPDMKRFLEMTGARAASTAVRNIWRITGRCDEAKPVVLVGLRASGQYYIPCNSALSALREMGPAGKWAAPEVERLLYGHRCSMAARKTLEMISAPAGGGEFIRVLGTGSNPEIEKAAKRLFVVGADAAKHAVVLTKAQELKKHKTHFTYRFWLRGQDPKVEGDGWVQVEINVHREPRTVKAVRTVVLKK